MDLDSGLGTDSTCTHSEQARIIRGSPEETGIP